MQAIHKKFAVKDVAAVCTLLVSAIVATPMCGWIFQCGCDWPWYGLNEACNFYQAGQGHRCPWCVSMTTGIVSIGLAIVAGVVAAGSPLKVLAGYRFATAFLASVSLGLSIFFLLMVLFGVLSASLQHYPLKPLVFTFLTASG